MASSSSCSAVMPIAASSSSSALKPKARNINQDIVEQKKKLIRTMTKAGFPRPPMTEPSYGFHVPEFGVCKTAKEIFEDSIGQFDVDFVDSLTISVDDDILQEYIAADEHDEGTTKALTLLPGIYWRIGECGSAPVFRQEPSVEISSEELFMLYSPLDGIEGWWIVKEPFETIGEFEATSKYAYISPPEEDRLLAPMACRVHIPYWSKESLIGCHIEPTHDRAKRILDDLVKEKEMLETERPEQAMEETKPLGQKKDTFRKAPNWKEPSGWCNKAAALAAAVLREDWVEAQRMAEKINEHPLASKAVKKLNWKHY